MEDLTRPFFTRDETMLRAYLADGRILVVDQNTRVQQDWPSLFLEAEPAFMGGMRTPGPREVITDQVTFSAAWIQALGVLNQAATAVLPGTVFYVTPPVVEDEEDPFGAGTTYHTKPSEADQAPLAMKESQKDEIRRLLDGKVPGEILVRFDFRHRNAYTQLEAEVLISRLRRDAFLPAATA